MYVLHDMKIIKLTSEITSCYMSRLIEKYIFYYQLIR